MIVSPTQPAEIRAFRVLVSGEPETFDDIDSALGYLRSQAVHNHIESIQFEAVNLNPLAYAAEVEGQELAGHPMNEPGESSLFPPLLAERPDDYCR